MAHGTQLVSAVGYESVSFEFRVPLDVRAPTFGSDLIALDWSLEFVFVVGDRMDGGAVSDGGVRPGPPAVEDVVASAAAAAEVEWSLPLTVVAPTDVPAAHRVADVVIPLSSVDWQQ